MPNEIHISVMHKRHTKILATIGPSSEPPEMLEKLFKAGLNACRLNLSHGDHAEHGSRVKNIREISTRLNWPVSIVLDLCGPKVRTDTMTYEIAAGETWRLVAAGKGDPATKRMGIQQPNLYQIVKPGQVILFDDGKMDVVVTAVEGDEILCTVRTGGKVKSRKSVNTPGADNGLDVLSEKDKKDAIFGKEAGVDWVCLSFVRHAKDINDSRAYFDSIGWHGVPIIAKIETPLAVECLEDIIKVVDGIMVARGDLGIECPTEEVPVIQKRAVKLARKHGKLLIVATQMLDSMERNPRPTRAEASDVANAVFDGTQVVMLSGETASGDYPEQAVQTMATIARKAEGVADIPQDLPTICCQSQEMIAAALRLHTHSKSPVLGIFSDDAAVIGAAAAFHSDATIVALTTDRKVYQRVALHFGVVAVLVPAYTQIDAAIPEAIKEIKARELVDESDRIVFLYATPVGAKTHNTIRLVPVAG